MLRSCSTRRDLGFKVRGGLSPVIKRRVFDYVDANLDQPLTIEELARPEERRVGKERASRG